MLKTAANCFPGKNNKPQLHNSNLNSKININKSDDCTYTQWWWRRPKYRLNKATINLAKLAGVLLLSIKQPLVFPPHYNYNTVPQLFICTQTPAREQHNLIGKTSLVIVNRLEYSRKDKSLEQKSTINRLTTLLPSLLPEVVSKTAGKQFQICPKFLQRNCWFVIMHTNKRELFQLSKQTNTENTRLHFLCFCVCVGRMQLWFTVIAAYFEFFHSIHNNQHCQTEKPVHSWAADKTHHKWWWMWWNRLLLLLNGWA